MSRGRPIEHNGDVLWFDTKNGHLEATGDQLELLSLIEKVDIDDIFDESLSQGDVLYRIRDALGHIPPKSILNKSRKIGKFDPCCRICNVDCHKHRIKLTKHHFVNKWILKELDKYQQRWADRSRNTIPVCLECHRILHSKQHGPHSIYQYLTPEELDFAERALSALAEERPKLLILIARGDEEVYEAKLVKDWFDGKFQST